MTPDQVPQRFGIPFGTFNSSWGWYIDDLDLSPAPSPLPPAITAQPQTQSPRAGTRVTLNVVAVGTGRFGFKVTGAVTIKRFPNLPRFGAKGGQSNPDFLNADLFGTTFLKPCEEIRARIGVLMFEFSRFWPADYEHGRDFVNDLDSSLGQFPKGWPYAVEMRNKHWLRDEYFGCLARHHITHVFNSWGEMPSVSDQMALPGSRTNPELIAARFLLKPGRKYEDAVKTFHPYDKIREVNEEARKAGTKLINEGERDETPRKTFIFVNNRLEGNALATIAAMLEPET